MSTVTEVRHIKTIYSFFDSQIKPEKAISEMKDISHLNAQSLKNWGEIS